MRCWLSSTCSASLPIRTAPGIYPGFRCSGRRSADSCSRFGDRVVFTRFLAPDVPVGAWREYYREWSFAREPAGTALSALASPWNDTRLPVIDKITFSGYGQELRESLGRAHADTLVLCGVSTECCVLATAMAAADGGVAVRIVGDACASVDRATHEAALHVAVTGFAPLITVTTVDEEVAR